MNIPANEYTNTHENDFEILFEIKKYAQHWRWFLLSSLLFLAIAFLYLRNATPQYKVASTVLVKDDAKGGLMSEMSAFSDLGLGSVKSNVDNEIEILKSRTLIESTVRQLQLNVQLFVKKGIFTTEELYDAPFMKASFQPTNPSYAEVSRTFEIKPLPKGGFELIEDIEKTVDKKSLLVGSNRIFQFGTPIITTVGTLVIHQKEVDPERFGQKITVVIKPIDEVVDALMKGLTIAPISKTSSVVSLSIVHPVQQKAEDFLNTLVKIYNINAIDNKNFISENTSKFIANRLLLISQELDGVEKEVQNFKQTHNITDIVSQADLFVQGSTEYAKKEVETEIQLNVLASMLEILKSNKNTDLLPGNLLSGDGDESGMIATYNKLLLDRNRLSKSATEDNPAVVRLDQQITSMKSNVASSLQRLKATLQIQKRDLGSQQGRINAKIEKIPLQERQFRVIARQQKVKEELYLYLLQKREETALALSASEPSGRVVDAARADPIAVSPKNGIVVLASLLLGLLIPFGVIYLKQILDTKINSKLDLDQLSTIPFIGDVPTSESPGEIMTVSSRSSSAEALRIIRTNLEFMFAKVPSGRAKTIFLTSTLPSEGKTFVSVNLAATFALSGKKVLLIGMDIRNPRLSDYINVPERGVTSYLSTNKADIKEYLHKYPGFEDFWVLPAGVIPPNPAELLLSSKIDTLFEELKSQFDYIIVDTAPVSLVTDTLLIAKHADAFCYVVRANYLDKRMLAIPNGLYKEQKLPNMCLLLNDTDSAKGYGYGYGYGAKIKNKSW